MKPLTKRHLVATALLFLVFGSGPAVGDVGGCGATATELDEVKFANARKTIDCRRCGECAIAADHCVRACDAVAPSDVSFPKTCRPLLHDGEVCLRALLAASCSAYASYVDDIAPAVPSECDFCQVGPAPAGSLKGAAGPLGAPGATGAAR